MTQLLDSLPARRIAEEPRFEPNITFRCLASLLPTTGATEPAKIGAV